MPLPCALHQFDQILFINFTLITEIKSIKYYAVVTTTEAIEECVRKKIVRKQVFKRQNVSKTVMFHFRKIVIKTTFLSS